MSEEYVAQVEGTALATSTAPADEGDGRPDLFEDILDVEAALRLAVNGFAPAPPAGPDAIETLAGQLALGDREAILRLAASLRAAIAQDDGARITAARQTVVSALAALRTRLFSGSATG